MKVLFAASEVFPLLKTGGLGDVADSLPSALREHGLEVRVAIPAYRLVLEKVGTVRVLGWLSLSGGFHARILETQGDESWSPLWLVDIPARFDREGSPYTNADGHDWHDNPERYRQFSEAVAALAADGLGLGWVPDIVHANDWQTGLVPAFLSLRRQAPRSVFTIHNMAYDCQFDRARFDAMKLPAQWWSMHLGEYYGQYSMLKSGMVFSDWITTVSPTYADEIRTVEYGYGYSTVLEAHADKLTGILNGIDTTIWNPKQDPLINRHYDIDGKIRSAKRANRLALLEGLGAPQRALDSTAPLVGSIGRMVHQKGIDLLLDAIPNLLAGSDVLFVLIGAGQPDLEQQLRTLAATNPDRVFCFIGYSESLAHQIEAGSDLFAMPSRYEPCGLNQMYSLRYGTPPVVRSTGGLADTVVDATPAALDDGRANGFTFEPPTTEALTETLLRALSLFEDPGQWMKLIKAGMRADHSWHASAAEYVGLYRKILS